MTKKNTTRSDERDKTTPEEELNLSDDIRNGFFTGPGVYRLPVQYCVVDGGAIVGNYYDMGPDEYVEAETLPTFELMGVGLPTNSTRFWPNGIAPFVINNNLQNLGRVNQNIIHLQERSAIRLGQRTNQLNFVEFDSANGNLSRVCMVSRGQLKRLSENAPVGTGRARDPARAMNLLQTVTLRPRRLHRHLMAKHPAERDQQFSAIPSTHARVLPAASIYDRYGSYPGEGSA